jgi:hypothetical protein
MPAGKFSNAETTSAMRRLNTYLNAQQQEHDNDETRLKMALVLIKTHITNEQTAQNEDLHNAIGLIVDFARKHGHLTR